MNSGSGNVEVMKLSGVILLCLSIQKPSINSSLIQQRILWGRSIEDMAKISKPNIMASPSMSHNESNGLYYSFGNVGAFKKVNNSSVGQYVIKKSTNEDKKDEKEEIANLIEKMISVELKIAVENLSTIIPNLKMLIAPVLDVAYDLQDEHGNIGMKRTTIGRGIWSTCLCVKAITGLFHNEDDCTYTIISIPK